MDGSQFMQSHILLATPELKTVTLCAKDFPLFFTCFAYTAKITCFLLPDSQITQTMQQFSL